MNGVDRMDEAEVGGASAFGRLEVGGRRFEASNLKRRGSGAILNPQPAKPFMSLR